MISNHLQSSIRRMYTTWTEITNSKMDYEALVFGSSEAWVVCVSKVLTDSTQLRIYNSSINGSKFDKNRAKVKFESEQFPPFFYNKIININS